MKKKSKMFAALWDMFGAAKKRGKTEKEKAAEEMKKSPAWGKTDSKTQNDLMKELFG